MWTREGLSFEILQKHSGNIIFSVGNVMIITETHPPHLSTSYLYAIFSKPLLSLLLGQTHTAVLKGGEHCGGHLTYTQRHITD